MYSNIDIINYYKDRTVYDCNCLEFWAEIPDRAMPGIIPGRYWVSNFGNTYNINTGKPIPLGMHRKGYYQLVLPGIDQFGNRKTITRKLHRVVMLTFAYFPGCEKFTVNHMDTNKLNNHILNLEWATESENTIHAINNGVKMVFGRPVTVFTEEQIDELIELSKTCANNGEAARVFNTKYGSHINRNYVNNVLHGRCRHGRISKTKYYGL